MDCLSHENVGAARLRIGRHFGLAICACGVVCVCGECRMSGFDVFCAVSLSRTMWSAESVLLEKTLAAT